MIRDYVKVKWLNLRRDIGALGVTFGLPIGFFTIFVGLFGSLPMGGGDSDEEQRTVEVCVLDQDTSELSRRFIDALAEREGLQLVDLPPAVGANSANGAREAIRLAVRKGDITAALIIPAGWQESLTRGFPPSERTTEIAEENERASGVGVAIELIYDPANPFARYGIQGSVQVAAMQAIPDVLMEEGFDWLDRFGGGMSNTERAVTRRLLEKVREMTDADASVDRPPGTATRSGAQGPGGDQFAGFVQIEATSAREVGGNDLTRRPKQGTLTVYYAAGLGVMFLLFSVTAAGGALLEEEQRGTLQRMLASDIRMATILLGNWLFFASLGFLQVTLMFVWGAVIFGIDLWTANHLTGFLLMTVATASAAAAFGLVLATLCRSPAQLNGFGTIVVLIMSALGGSMIPRFVMPSFLDTTSKFTFNGWALDGYLKVFWYDDPTHTVWQTALRLLPELAVLLATTFVFMAIARLLARRWEVI